MPEIINQQDRKARKAHTCSYCNYTIEKGEPYDWTQLKYEGKMYEWKAHKDCSVVASELWEFIDPDDGMTDDDFSTGCTDFCNAFICPNCEKYNTTDYDGECDNGETYCLDKIVGVLKKYSLERVDGKYGWKETFKLFEREPKE